MSTAVCGAFRASVTDVPSESCEHSPDADFEIPIIGTRKAPSPEPDSWPDPDPPILGKPVACLKFQGHTGFFFLLPIHLNNCLQLRPPVVRPNGVEPVLKTGGGNIISRRVTSHRELMLEQRED